ncbi:MAG: biotin/lipoyl-containing protein [Planctomycetota bacterium]|jgi:pyruvate/2-oxoglutarate dehydrogenase complex dihydrolipoamide acyltransferase (E2) component
MQLQVVLPDFGEPCTATFTVERWLCLPGASVGEGEPLLQVRFGKALHLLDSPAGGNLILTRIRAGMSARAGAVLAFLDA